MSIDVESGFSSAWPKLYGAPAKFGPANVLRALGASKTGEVISLNLPLSDPADLVGRGAFKRTMRLHNFVTSISDNRHVVANDDEVFFALQGSSQWDALAHVGQLVTDGSGVYYGGRGLEETSPQGTAPNLGIHALGPAIITRGVLLDFVAHFSREDPGFLSADVVIGRSDVEACIARQGVVIEPGDAVLIFTGYERRRASLGGIYPDDAAGLDGTTVALWAELDLLALAADNRAVEANPTTFDLHLGMLREHGIPLGELWALDALTQACRSDGRHDFLLVGIPLNIPGAFGSPANAVAIR